MDNKIKTKDLASILVDAVVEESFIDKNVLIPKFKVLIQTFRLKLASLNYNAIQTPSKTAIMIREGELRNYENVFWREELKSIVGLDNMEQYYVKLRKQKLLWEGENDKKEGLDDDKYK